MRLPLLRALLHEDTTRAFDGDCRIDFALGNTHHGPTKDNLAYMGGYLGLVQQLLDRRSQPYQEILGIIYAIPRNGNDSLDERPFEFHCFVDGKGSSHVNYHCAYFKG